MSIYRVVTLLFLLFFFAGCTLTRPSLVTDPLTPQEHLELGLAYEEQGDFSNALREYRAASQELPIAHLYMGNAAFQAGRTEEAEQSYRTAISMLPDNPRPYNNLAWLYHTEQRNLGQAEELARHAVDLAPAESKALYLDTLAQIKKGRKELAE